MVCAQEPAKNATNTSVKVEDQEILVNMLLTLSSIRNPFIPILPSPQIVESTSNQITTTTSSRSKPTSVKPVEVTETKNVSPPALPKFIISGLVWNTDNPQAIINQEIVEIGDTVDDWTIVAITEDGIKVSSKGFLQEIPNSFSDIKNF